MWFSNYKKRHEVLSRQLDRVLEVLLNSSTSWAIRHSDGSYELWDSERSAMHAAASINKDDDIDSHSRVVFVRIIELQ